MPIPLALSVAGPSIRPQSKLLVGASVAAVLRVGTDLARPWPLALAIDCAVDGRSRAALPEALRPVSPATLLLITCGSLLILTAASGLLDYAATSWSEQAAERIGADLRARMFQRMLGLSLRWHDRMRRGELQSRLTGDVGRLLDAIVGSLALLLPDTALLVGILLVLLHIDLTLALAGLAVVPVLALLAHRKRQRVRAVEQTARAAAGQLAATAADLLGNVRAVQAFGRRDLAVQTYRRRNEKLLDAELTSVRVEARWTPAADLVLAAGTGLVLVAGGLKVLDGRVTTGELVVVLAYIAELYSPIRALCRLASTLAKASASAERVSDVLTCTEASSDHGTLDTPAPQHELRFESVWFGYRPDAPVLRGFDLTVRAGETVCLWGASGAGKTTVLQLLLRLYDVDAGRISIDGTDLREMRIASLRSQIAFVPQDPWLLDASIAENIAFGAPRATRAEITRAGSFARLEDVVEALPDGYDTPIGEGGVLLSGGQRRRIALARAIVSRAPIVLLDEPTASLDAHSAEAIVHAIRSTTVGRTVLMVTHDPALARTADRVVTVPAVNPKQPTQSASRTVSPVERDGIPIAGRR